MFKCGLVSVSFRKHTVDEIISACKNTPIKGFEWGSDIHVPEGDIKLAGEVYKKTVSAGLEVFAYGSYYRVGEYEDAKSAFQPYLVSAIALHAPVIRVWAGTKGTGDATAEYAQKIISDTQIICDMAAEHNIKIAFEYHQGTLTDSFEAALMCVKLINRGNMRLLWQPDYTKDFETNIRAIQGILPYMENVHTFFWDKDYNRKLLIEGKDYLIPYIKEIKKSERDRAFLLEFVKDNDISILKQEAEVLNDFLEEA